MWLGNCIHDLPCEASGSLCSVSLSPRTNIHGTDLKPTDSLGSRPAALPPGAEQPSLDQPNHSQPAEHEQENKWGGVLCSIVTETADQYKRSKQNPNQKAIASSKAIWHNWTTEALKWDYGTKHAFHGQINHSVSTPLYLVSALSSLKEINPK